MMRRRKSSCPDAGEHHNRRASSSASNSTRSGVKLDLYIEDDDIFVPGLNRRKSPTNTSSRSSPIDYRSNIEEMAEEVLCLRLLSIRTRYRFGGLKIHILSPVFSIDKLFNVEFDAESQISLIKSQQCSDKEKPQPTTLDDAKMATIVISPDPDDYDSGKKPSVSAELTLFEEPAGSQLTRSVAHSVNRAEPAPPLPPPPPPPPPAPSTSKPVPSLKGENIDFSNVKVYATIDRSEEVSRASVGSDASNTLEAIDLEIKRNHAKPNKQSNRAIDSEQSDLSGKRLGMRRHTHYHCYIPSSLSTHRSTSATGSRNNLGEKDSTNGSPGGSKMLKRFFGKKMNDTMHSASRFKKYLSESLFSSKPN